MVFSQIDDIHRYTDKAFEISMSLAIECKRSRCDFSLCVFMIACEFVVLLLGKSSKQKYDLCFQHRCSATHTPFFTPFTNV